MGAAARERGTVKLRCSDAGPQVLLGEGAHTRGREDPRRRVGTDADGVGVARGKAKQRLFVGRAGWAQMTTPFIFGI